MANNNGINKEEYARDALEQYVKNCKIFIDTCSLLNSAADKFWLNVIPLLQIYNMKIIVLLRSLDELEKHSKNKNKPELMKDANNCIKVMNQLMSAGYIEVRGESTDNFADNVFQVVFTKFRMTHNLLLITQDNDLAKDILALNDNRSVKANPVQVKRINKYGFLSDFNWNGKINNTESKRKNNGKKTIELDLNPDEVFKICTVITKLPDTRINIYKMPFENEIVYTPQGSVRLTKQLGVGGEAAVYETNTPYVAKIYKKENITTRKYEKIKLMLTKEIDCTGICYPVAILHNSNKEFVGYLMPKAKGIELQKSVFGPKPLFLKKFPGWKKRDTVELCVTILEKIKYLHDRNVIIGDINPANILVVSPKEVYFVDTDSFQVEDFPCPVGTINFTAPEIQRKHFSDFLRTMGNENFAVATLLFMIMLPGKPPYSQQGGEDPVSNIMKMDFSYPFGESSNKKTPEGPWRYIWSHLTYDLKEAFYNTFRKGGEYSLENKRLSVNEWLLKFSYFLELLDSGKYGQQDKMSEELFPTRLKKNPKATYINCKLCQHEVEESQCKNGICRNCLNQGEVYKCKKCGKELLFTNYQKYVKNAKRYDVCQECFDRGNAVRVTRNCINCGKTFELTNNQYDFYRQKGYDIPKRCKACRDSKKISGYENTYSNNSSRSNLDSHIYSNGSSNSSSGSLCFITTAVCEYYGKDDNCEELIILRNYRDTWLKQQSDGIALITEYYNSAPLIVSILKKSLKYAEYCEILMKDFIRPCIDLIKEGKYLECKKLYISMVNYARGIVNNG